jgi:xanthine/uracil/vitamin C permease (AzgA family)
MIPPRQPHFSGMTMGAIFKYNIALGTILKCDRALGAIFKHGIVLTLKML